MQPGHNHTGSSRRRACAQHKAVSLQLASCIVQQYSKGIVQQYNNLQQSQSVAVTDRSVTVSDSHLKVTVTYRYRQLQLQPLTLLVSYSCSYSISVQHDPLTVTAGKSITVAPSLVLSVTTNTV